MPLHVSFDGSAYRGVQVASDEEACAPRASAPKPSGEARPTGHPPKETEEFAAHEAHHHRLSRWQKVLAGGLGLLSIPGGVKAASLFGGESHPARQGAREPSHQVVPEPHPSTTSTTSTTTAPKPPPPPAPADPALEMFSNVQKQWSEPYPGIRHLQATADGQQLHIVEVDLKHGAYDLRATRPDERGETVSQFASKVGALVAVNADYFHLDGSFQPYGLAEGDGVVWGDTQDSPDWSVMGCDAQDVCTFDAPYTSQAIQPGWKNAVGGANEGLLHDGQLTMDPNDQSREPRTAVGTTPDGKLILVQVDGRRGDAVGVTPTELAQILKEMGANNGMMLDGGGSSELVIGGSVVNRPSDGHERVVGNHLAIVPGTPSAP